ncbi:MAG: prolipoprotein diacylglyceryl transferase family protein [Gemmatimonas sp.]
MWPLLAPRCRLPDLRGLGWHLGVQQASSRISSYLTMLYIGCALGIVQGATIARANGLDELRFVLSAIALMIPAFGASRLWFVAQRFEMFRGNASAIWRSGDGGAAALSGGLVGGVVLSPLVLSVAGLPFLQYWDAASITMLIALVVTRFGCLMNGCCVGRATTGPLGLWLPDIHGRCLRRFPTQLLESAWAAIVLAAVITSRSHSRHRRPRFQPTTASRSRRRVPFR